ncbi:ABC transporter substrate-binding protein [Sphingomonas immobilis]|uniref:ABC transporter substrate-binding protein n=1 Tax=Sphingomonas immobilis TaxID=3063997 RepID=A0ABT8ZXN4_9SPHN|nr:ABC transporter substrate-binding protein [Sphingomonas sp. CA1-15]MDO7842335.1 ABC transporter substrate-binding protein [Sphingomonas sp. CA1-15]
MVDRRRFLIGAGAAGIGLTVASCGGARKDDVPVLRAAIIGRGEADYRLLFKAAGLAPQGFRLEYSEFQSGQLAVEALNGNSLDVAGMSEIPPIFAAASAIQSFKQVAVSHGDVNNQVVLVPKGSAIKSLADLKGKRVAYVRATTTQYFLIKMLESVGLKWSDITPVAMGVSDGAAAFGRGSIDAWAIFGFPIQRAIATEGARILKTASGFLSGNYIVSAHVDTLADPAKSKLVGDYLTLLRRGYAWADAHQDAWAAAIAKDIGVPKSYVLDQFARKSDSFSLRPVTPAAIQSQQEVADVFLKAGSLPHPVDVRPLWDDRFNSLIEKAL